MFEQALYLLPLDTIASFIFICTQSPRRFSSHGGGLKKESTAASLAIIKANLAKRYLDEHFLGLGSA